MINEVTSEWQQQLNSFHSSITVQMINYVTESRNFGDAESNVYNREHLKSVDREVSRNVNPGTVTGLRTDRIHCLLLC